MNPFSPSVFFDLSSFKHAFLFHEIKFVWEALSQIDVYLKTQDLGIVDCKIPEGVFLVDPHLISIGKGSVIEPGAYIKGPCIIGENCSIRQGAYIRGGVITGNECVIGHVTEIKNSILLNGAKAAHFAYVGDSILGNLVNLGAGTVCANLRFDKKNISVHYLTQKIDTKRHKLGAILGDGAQTGCNSVTNPGTLFGKNTYCNPTANVGGFISEKTHLTDK